MINGQEVQHDSTEGIYRRVLKIIETLDETQIRDFLRHIRQKAPYSIIGHGILGFIMAADDDSLLRWVIAPPTREETWAMVLCEEWLQSRVKEVEKWQKILDRSSTTSS